MLRSLALVLVLPLLARSQTADVQARLDANLAAQRYVLAQRQPDGGYRPTADARASSLRATSAAVRALKYLGGDLPKPAETAAFVLGCYDPNTGGFAEPGGQPDVTLTSVGIMAAAELGIPREKYAKALAYLGEHARTFEEVRFAAGAVEAFGVKDARFPRAAWFEVARQEAATAASPRAAGSVTAIFLRLGEPLPKEFGGAEVIVGGQLADGGYGASADKGSDLETTYRVTRAMHLLKTPPKDPAKLRAFVASCRNADGGFGLKPGEPSGVGGVYFAAIIAKWLDGFEAK